MDGQVMVGFCVSLTVMVNEQGGDILPVASDAVQVTVVVPTGKVEPDAGVHVTLTPGQLSLAVGAAKATTAEHWPGSGVVVMLAGHVIVGFCASLTVTVNEHIPSLPAASMTRQVTVVMPTGKLDPDAGEQVTAPVPEQLSPAVGIG